MTEPQHDHAAVRLFPPSVPLVTVLAGIVLQWIWPLDIGWQLSPFARYLLGGLIVVGSLTALGVWPLLLFRQSSQRVEPWEPTPEVLQHGPYRLTRNPMYLQMVLICIGLSIILWNAWILVLTPLCAWVLQKYAIEPEEAYLERKFGDSYVAYKSKVRRWI